MTESEKQKELFSVEEDKYGDEYKKHLLEQYKLYVEMADRVSTRRVQANQFYISLLSVVIALLSFAIKENFFSNILILPFVVAFLGLSICLLWEINIRSYRELNSGKFKVIHEMERYLPFPAYKKEWEILKKEKRYSKLTKVEQYVPSVLAFTYFLLIIYLFYLLIKPVLINF